jgi:YggT family protein
MKRALVTIIKVVFGIVIFAAILYFCLSLFNLHFDPFFQPVARFLCPLLSPIQRVIPTLLGIDISPLVLILVLSLVQWLVVSLWGSSVDVKN